MADTQLVVRRMSEQEPGLSEDETQIASTVLVASPKTARSSAAQSTSSKRFEHVERIVVPFQLNSNYMYHLIAGMSRSESKLLSWARYSLFSAFPSLWNHIDEAATFPDACVSDFYNSCFRTVEQTSFYQIRVAFDSPLRALASDISVVVPTSEDHMGILTAMDTDSYWNDKITYSQIAAVVTVITPYLLRNLAIHGKTYSRKMARAVDDVEGVYFNGSYMTEKERKILYCVALAPLRVSAAAFGVTSLAVVKGAVLKIDCKMIPKTTRYGDIKDASQLTKYIECYHVISGNIELAYLLPIFVVAGFEKVMTFSAGNKAIDLPAQESDSEVANSVMFVKHVLSAVGAVRKDLITAKYAYAKYVIPFAEAYAKSAKNIKGETEKW